MKRLRYLRLTRRARLAVWLGVPCVLLLALCVAMLVHLKPVLVSMAVSRVNNSVNRIVASAVSEAVSDGEIEYDALITLDKDGGGHITALRSNMREANRLQTGITDRILQRLGEVSTTELSIPVGTLTGSALLAGRGPALRVRMQTVGSASASFHNEFSAAGINQTRHRILLRIDVAVSILLPTFTTSTLVSNEMAVAETVIVGTVPDNYTNFSTLPSQIEQYAEDYIMNNG